MEVTVGGPSAKRHGVALIDDADYELIAQHRWHIFAPRPLTDVAYAATNIKRADGSWTTLKMHRLILPGHPSIDHINRNGLDNRRSNLRPATKAQNMANRAPNVSAISRYKGVTWHQGRGLWMARIQDVDGRHYLGMFAAEEDAARAYDAAAIEHFGQYARLNFNGN